MYCLDPPSKDWAGKKLRTVKIDFKSDVSLKQPIENRKIFNWVHQLASVEKMKRGPKNDSVTIFGRLDIPQTTV